MSDRGATTMAAGQAERRSLARQNVLLASLPDSSLAPLLPHMHVTRLRARQVWYESGLPVDDVLFPLSGMIGLMITLSDGFTIETAAVGNEGFVGLPAVFGVPSAPRTAIVQLPGTGVVVPAITLRARLREDADLSRAVGAYANFVVLQTIWAAACLARHTLAQRCAKWLLLTQDRVGGSSLELTHEFLAEMLGAVRPSLTEAAQSLKKLGLISYERGRVTIIDRAGLEAAACECYAVLRDAMPRPAAARSSAAPDTR